MIYHNKMKDSTGSESIKVSIVVVRTHDYKVFIYNTYYNCNNFDIVL